MASDRARRAASLAGGTLALMAVAFAAAQVCVSLIVQRSYRDFSARTRELEAYAASEALSEHFQNILDHADVVAGFSFPEYFQGKRGEDSMRRLLDEMRKSVPGGLATAYLDAPGRARIESGSDGESRALDSLVAGSAAAWSVMEGSTRSLFVVAGVGPRFDCYLRVSRDGRLAGLLGMAIDSSSAISRYVAPFESRRGHRISLLGAGGLVLWSSRDGAAGRRFEAGEGVISAERGLSFGEYGLRLAVSDDRATIFSLIDPREFPRTLVIALIASLVVAAAALSIRLFRSEARRRASDAAKRWLSEAVRNRDFELVESEIRFRSLFDGASDAILILNEEGVIVRCNDRVRQVLGREPKELLGKTPADISPEIQPGGSGSADHAAEIIRRALADPSETLSLVWRGFKDGGQERDFEVDLSVVETGGIRYLQAILRDATERRQQMKDLREALEQREILLHELHHRVKNNLQYIVSLLELQRRFEPEDGRSALSRAQGRISSLAEAYLSAAEVPETLIVEAPAFLDGIVRLARGDAAVAGVWLEVSIACDDFKLSLDAALSLGLILREIVDNAARHAYAPGRGGPLEISLKSEGPSHARLSVRDRGRGMADGWKDGLGLTIARALAAQLSGEFELADAGPGVVATLRFSPS
jgi:PAS domain S-box-containing protein